MFSSDPINRDFGTLLLRLAAGGGMAAIHGWPKLMAFTDKLDTFPDPLGISSELSLVLTVFAEFFCAILVALGLYTRAFCIPLIITMAVAAFIVHGGDSLGKRELALVYLLMYGAILFLGAGKYSLARVTFR